MTAIADVRADYVSAVAVELADLAPDDRIELIEELDDHLAALLADRPGADLLAELGTPRAYAAELRAAAGLDRRGPVRVPLARQWAEFTARVADVVPARLRPTLAVLPPVWWVARGYLVAAGLAVGFGNDTTWSIPFVPEAGGPVGGAVLTLALIGLSVWFGQRRPVGGWWTGLRIAAAVAAMWGAVALNGAYTMQPTDTSGYAGPYCGTTSNLYAYDAQGRPLADVRLFDEFGNPYDVSNGCDGTTDNLYPRPSTPAGVTPVPTGPPSSLAPLPGASVAPSTPPSTP